MRVNALPDSHTISAYVRYTSRSIRMLHVLVWRSTPLLSRCSHLNSRQLYLPTCENIRLSTTSQSNTIKSEKLFPGVTQHPHGLYLNVVPKFSTDQGLYFGEECIPLLSEVTVPCSRAPLPP
jgi:hypothetical protein